MQRLSLLSGGEKALGAISFLFALFLARPCPFYLLDEVEAALDDTNIGRFVELLRTYSDRAQFVVITHQKRTMEAADVLYGVTMGGDGISQIVSRRLPREEAKRSPRPVASRWRGAGRSFWARPVPLPEPEEQHAGPVRAAARLALEVAARARRADRRRRVRPGDDLALGAARGSADPGATSASPRRRSSCAGSRRAASSAISAPRSPRKSRRCFGEPPVLHVDGRSPKSAATSSASAALRSPSSPRASSRRTSSAVAGTPTSPMISASSRSVGGVPRVERGGRDFADERAPQLRERVAEHKTSRTCLRLRSGTGLAELVTQLRAIARERSYAAETASASSRGRRRDDLRDAVAAHRDAVQHVGSFHRSLLMGDDDELRAVGDVRSSSTKRPMFVSSSAASTSSSR